MPNIRALALPVLLILVSGCVVEQPRERVSAVGPPVAAGVAIEAPAPVLVVRAAPPAPMVEEVPAPRPGYVWAVGHWRWNGERHVWAKGHWEPARVGYRYVQPHWDQVGGEWHFTAGLWVRG